MPDSALALLNKICQPFFHTSVLWSCFLYISGLGIEGIVWFLWSTFWIFCRSQLVDEKYFLLDGQIWPGPNVNHISGTKHTTDREDNPPFSLDLYCLLSTPNHHRRRQKMCVARGRQRPAADDKTLNSHKIPLFLNKLMQPSVSWFALSNVSLTVINIDSESQ